MKAFPRLADHWYKAVVWLCFTALGVGLPLGAGLVFVAAVSAVSFKDFTDGGQFSLLAAALVTGTAHLIAKPGSRLPWTEWFLWFAILGVFLSSVFFTLALLLTSGIAVETAYFRWPSVGLAVAALLVSFAAVGFDENRISAAAAAERNQDRYDEMSRQFNEKLAGGDTNA